MSAEPKRDTQLLIDPAGDDADHLRSLVSAMLGGSCPEETYLREAVALCQAKPGFGRRLLEQMERYSRLGQMPAAQYTRVRQKIEESMVARGAAPSAPDAPAPPRGQGKPGLRDTPAAGSPVHPSPRVPGLPAEATVTAPLPIESSLPSRPSRPRSPAASPAASAASAAPAARKPSAAAAKSSAPARKAAPASQRSSPPAAPASHAKRLPSAAAPTSAAPVETPEPLQERPVAPPAAVEPRPAAIEPGTVLRERYELEGLLGCGGMATVYKALDRYRARLGLADCHVALKIIGADSPAPADEAALGREFHNAQQLSHPNIVNVFNIDHEAGATFYTMELLEGEQLDELLERLGGPLPCAQALAIVRDIGAAIGHAHSRGILHADLKPQNVFVTYGGQVLVLDFGGLGMLPPGPWIGEPVVSPAAERYRTATPAYASCEQLEGQQVDPRDDIYALACIGYELLTGRHPFDGHSALQARAQHLHARRPSQLNASSWRALRRALSFQRAQRPRDIAPWLEQLGVAGAPARLPPSYELRALAPRSHWGRWVALAATLVLCVSGALALMLQNPGQWDWNRLLASSRSAVQQARSSLQERLGVLPDLPDHSGAAPGGASASTSAPAPDATELAAARAAEGHSVAPSSEAPPPATHQRRSAAELAQDVPPAPAAATPDVASGAVVPPPGDAAPIRIQGVEFSSTTYEVNDTSPAARVVVRRSGGTQDELRFVWWTLDDTAKADVDYAPLGRRTEHMLPGQDRVTLYVPIISNPLRHETATFYVALGRPGATESSPSVRASVTIDRGG